jgi:tight adherence protein C
VTELQSFLQGSTLELVLAAAAGMVFVVALAAGVRAMFSGRSEVIDRLERVKHAEADVFGDGAVTAPASDAESGASAFFARVLRPLSRLARPTKREELSRAKLDLIRAGYRGEFALEIFLGLKLLMAPIITLIFLQINAQLTNPVQFPVDMVVAIWLCGTAFWVPNLWLRSKISERQLNLEKALPDAMDLLVTCVEAGLGLDAAMARVADEMQLASPLLAEELNHTFLEVQAGIPRADSFRRLAERTGVEDLRSLSAMLIQTDLFGTSVARALRIHSDGMRVKRMQRAEERAAMVSVKMTIPLVLCILPSLIAVVMGPAIVMITKAFSGQ